VLTISIPERDMRRVVDEIDESEWRLIALEPKRDSLEDYFSRLLQQTEEGTVAQ